MADERPNSFRLQARAATQWMGVDRAIAEAYMLRAAAVRAQLDYETYPDPAVFVDLFPAWAAWLDGDALRALDLADAVVRRMAAAPLVARTQYWNQLATIYLALGRLHQADTAAASIPDTAFRTYGIAHVRLARENRDDLREFFRTPDLRIDDDYMVHYPLLMAGLLDRVRAVERRLAEDTWPDHALFGPYLRGAIACTEGRFNDCAQELAPFLEQLPRVANYHYRAARLLSDVRSRQGRLADGIRLLEAASRSRSQAVVGYWVAGEWLKTRAALADLYRQAGRVRDAQAVETELSGILALADADHPIKRRLAALERD